MPRTSSRPSQRVSWLLVALLLTALASSCGRSLTASVSPARGGAPKQSGGGGGGGGGGSGGGGTDISGEVVVTVAPGADAGAIATTYGATLLDYEVEERAASYLPAAGQTPLELQALLAADPRVLTAEPNGWLETAETRQQSFAFDDGSGTPQTFVEQPAAAAIRLAAAHEVALGHGVTVAILDSGIDPRHPLLRTSYAGGIDFIDKDDDPTDLRNFIDDDGDGLTDEGFGHGTHVAGIIHLVAPEARLLAVRVLDSDGRGDLFDIASGVRWAVDHGAKVINLSLGSLRSSDALQNSLEEAENRGVVVLVSAGNWGADTPVEFPAKSSHVAAIAAVDTDAHPASFTSYGNMVALCAPGVGVRSTFPGGGYRLWSGTSMAAPFVAGTCALLAENHPTWGLRDMMTRLAATAGPVMGGTSDYGAGALDAAAAVAADRRPHVDDPPVTEDMRTHR